MIKRIIVEGADQQGKTEFCNLLKKELGWQIVKFNKPEPNFDFFNGYLIPEHSISDRNFLSEVVYSQVRGDTCKIADIKELVDELNSLDTIIILMDRESNYVFDNTRYEDYTQWEILRARNFYRDCFNSLKNIRKFKVNPHSPGAIKSIIHSIKTNYANT